MLLLCFFEARLSGISIEVSFYCHEYTNSIFSVCCLYLQFITKDSTEVDFIAFTNYNFFIAFYFFALFKKIGIRIDIHLINEISLSSSSCLPIKFEHKTNSPSMIAA